MRRHALAPALLAALLASCGGGERPNAAAAPASAPAASAYAAMARGRIDMPGGLIRVGAPRAGVVLAWQAAVGDTVSAGQPLLTLDTRDAELAVEQARAEIALIEAEARAQRARLPAARERAARLRDAEAAGAVSGQAADDARQASVELEAQQAVQAATLAAARTRLAIAQRAVELGSVRASAAGRVSERLVRAGEGVEAHAPLALLIPQVPPIVLAELNEAMADRVKPGMRAEVLPAGADAPVLQAEVLRLGDRYVVPRDADETQGHARVLECELRLAGELPWRLGQRVLVRFLP